MLTIAEECVPAGELSPESIADAADVLMWGMAVNLADLATERPRTSERERWRRIASLRWIDAARQDRRFSSPLEEPDRETLAGLASDVLARSEAALEDGEPSPDLHRRRAATARRVLVSIGCAS